jgi:hypothetical protein
VGGVLGCVAVREAVGDLYVTVRGDREQPDELGEIRTLLRVAEADAWRSGESPVGELFVPCIESVVASLCNSSSEISKLEIAWHMHLVSIEARSARNSASSARPRRSSFNAADSYSASPSRPASRPATHSPIL